MMLFKELRQNRFSERPQDSSTGTYDQSNFNRKIIMKRWWNSSDTRKPMYPGGGGETFPSASLTKTNRTMTDMVSRPSLRCGRAETEDWNYLYCITYKILFRTSQRIKRASITEQLVNFKYGSTRPSLYEVCGTHISMCSVWTKFWDFVRYGDILITTITKRAKAKWLLPCHVLYH
jgi:hypothetical protein